MQGQLRVGSYDAKTVQGDVVALHAVPGCGESECTECSRDLPQICERGHHSGIGQDGFYAPYATLDIRGAVKVPDGKPRCFPFRSSVTMAAGVMSDPS